MLHGTMLYQLQLKADWELVIVMIFTAVHFNLHLYHGVQYIQLLVSHKWEPCQVYGTTNK